MNAALEPEQHLLGALMVDTRRLPDVAEIIGPDQFASRHHRTIYAVILELHDAGQPVDVVTVSERLERTGKIEEVGGWAYVGQLAQQVASTANVLAYARTVSERATDRAIRRAGADIAALVDADAPPAQKIDMAGEILLALSSATDPGEIRPLSDLIAGAVEEIEARFESQGGITGDPTGFEALDERWDGLNPCDLIVVAARPSMGKTALVLNIAAHASISRPVVVFELEMPGRQLVKRLFAAAGNLPFKKIKRGDLREFDWPKLTAAIGEVGNRKMVIDDRAGQTLSRIRTFARKVKRQQRDLGLVVVDYLQIMDDEARNGESRAMSIQRITTGLKSLAKELECPVMLVSQLNRASERRQIKKPQLSDLRDSGSVEQDADIVAFLHREDYYRGDDEEKDNLCEIITAKNRNGETGSDFLEWRGAFQQFATTHRTPKPRRERANVGMDL